jgi:surface antigen
MKAGAFKASALKAWTKTRSASLAVLLALGLSSHAALAHTRTHHAVEAHHIGAAHHLYARRNTHHHYAYARHHSVHYARYYGHHFARYSYSRLQCVPYAREVSHIQLSGDAFLWWAEASGRYARGNTPVEGAVLNFRSIRRMPLGHVAVVTAVIDSRTILVTQANWVRGSITNDVTMEDVSPNNDWSQVQVQLGDSSRWGAAYPTYGFIYNQPDGTTVPGMNTVIASATPSSDATQGDEVAEAPKPAAISSEAPDRNLQ